MTERERAKAIEAMRQADRDHHAIRTRTGDGRGIMPIYCKCDAGFVSKEELSRHVNEQRLRALLDGGYVVLTDRLEQVGVRLRNGSVAPLGRYRCDPEFTEPLFRLLSR